MKAISVRIDEKLGKQFDEVCRETGYKKNTLINRLIAAFVRHQRRSSPTKTKTKKPYDPFSKVIGLMDEPPLLASPDLIDRVVYDL